MYNHLTSTPPQQTHQQQHHDIYSILSTDMPDDAPIDTAELVKDIFDSSDFTTTTSAASTSTSVTAANTSTANNNNTLNTNHHHNTPNTTNDNNNTTSTTTNNNMLKSISTTTTATTTTTQPVSTTTSTDFSFSHDFMNFDMNQQYTPSSEVFNDPFLSTLSNSANAAAGYRETEQPPPSFSRQADFQRRHSVAVSGGIADLNNRFQPLSTYGVTTSHLPMTRKAQTLPTVMESQQQQQHQHHHHQQQHQQRQQHQQHQQLHHFLTPSANNMARLNNYNNGLDQITSSASSFNHLHRASMPNIFQTHDNQQQRAETHLQLNNNNSNNNNNNMSSTRTTPNSTPPPIHIQFNSLPWSQDEQQQLLPSSNMNSFHQQQQQQGPAVFQRRRFYSQCGLPTPPLHTQVQGLCPLPMSGVASRRASVATSNDIYTWNRNCANYKQQQEQQQQEQEDDDNEQPPLLKRPRKSSEPPPPQHQEPSTASEEGGSSDYPVITDADLEAAKKDANAIPRRQKLRFDSDEYTPKWVRYTGQLKEGYCDTCQPGKWLQLKNSAYWYHKQFFHGISSVSGKPFQKPLEQRAGEQDVIEGLCHQCHTFVPICNSKRKNSVLWYRHAHKCHIYDKPKSKGGKRASISTRKYSETPQSIF